MLASFCDSLQLLFLGVRECGLSRPYDVNVMIFLASLFGFKPRGRKEEIKHWPFFKYAYYLNECYEASSFIEN